MKVLKFGGTSVANAENIAFVKDIISKNNTTSIVVVSAFGGVTDVLLATATLASKQDVTYKAKLHDLEDRHLTTVKELIPIQAQSSVLSKVKSELNTLEALLEGAFLIGEITPQLSDKIVSFGELLSSYVICEYFKHQGLNVKHVDSREFIKNKRGERKSNRQL